MKKILLAFVSGIFHLLALAVIVYIAWPVARWYLDKIPARGVDLYLSASYVADLMRDFSLRAFGWKEFWFSGVPYSVDYPSLYFYLMVPFAKFFGLIPGIQMFAVFALFVFAGFSYLLYHQLSKNRILSAILVIATLLSANYYRALIWAGGIPFWTTQAFFPIVIFLVVKYCQTENRKWFYLASAATGLGIMGHPQNFLNLILPSAFVLLLLWRPKEIKFSPLKRLLDTFGFGFLSYLIGLPLLSAWLPLSNFKNLTGFLGTLLTIPFRREVPDQSSVSSAPSGLSQIEIWNRSQFNLVWSDTNLLIWILLAFSFSLFFVSLIFRKHRLKGLISFLPFFFIAAWAIGLVFLYSRGINVYVTGWYKAFWPVLATLGTLTAFLWGESKEVFAEREFWQKGVIKIMRWPGMFVLNIILVGLGIYFFLPSQTALSARLEKLDNFSSAFPEILNVKTAPSEWQALGPKLKPQLMTDNPKDYRLYVIDATVNIWWSTLEDMPQTRGYVDPPIERGNLFWLDAAIGPTNAGPKSSLIEDWDTPEWVADNNLSFLLDWYATKYLEGNHLSASNSNLASNITTDKFIEADEVVISQGGVVNRYLEGEGWSDDNKQSLRFYRVKKDLVSPILMGTNATPILHLGGSDGYDTLTRMLGEQNLGPRKVVLARGPKFLDDVSLSDLQNFPVLILYKYDYRNYDKVWRMIGKYVEKGGNVFVDTGPEVKESDTTLLPSEFPSELPGIFPIRKTIRESLGEGWEPEFIDDPLTEGVNFGEFSPLIFDKGPWNISHPIDESDLRQNAKSVLKQAGKTVVAEQKYGKGKVIWAGYNLPYHALRDYNFEEGKFLRNLLSGLADLEGKDASWQATWVSPRERLIEVSNAKGVLLKEQAFPGWSASFSGKGLKIYKVGPSDPGFMYVRLPQDASGKVKFSYNGSFEGKIYSGISLLLIVLILDYIFGGKVLMPLAGRFFSFQGRKMGKWWEKEDDY